MVNENIAPPKGVTKINSNTRDNVGKVFNDLNKFIKNSGTYLEDFNDSLDNVTLSMIKFKKEYDKQYKPVQKELNENLNDVVDAFEKNSKKFQDFLKITDDNNNDLKNFIFDVRENISNQSVANSNIAKKINSGISSFANKITEYMEMPNLDISKLMDNVGTIFDSINPMFENSLSNLINGNFDNIKNAIAVNSSRELSRDRRNEIDLISRNNDRELSRDSKRDDTDSKIREIQERIKSETKNNSKKFLDNKYAQGNEYDKLHNEYQKELEKLKIDALEVFGEGFDQQEGYKKALMNLDDEFNKKQHDVGINAIKESFKQESSDNKVKFLDNKYAVGNNYARKQNEYQDEIEKLKTQGLETYGEGFEQNKEYQMAMQNLEKKYGEEMHQAKIDDFKEKHQFLGEMYETISNSFKENEKSLRGIFGPLNLLVAPFEEFFGGSIFKFIGKGMKSFFGIFRKKRPTASDVAKSGGAGVGNLYVGNKIDELIKLQGGEGGGLGDLFGGGLLKGLLGGNGGLVSGILSKLPLIAGIAMIISSLIWAVVDGIKGMLKSDEWGVSKLSGFLGGFFAGTGEGWKNAFANAGKWALMGAGIGLIGAGPVGALAGGLIGAAVGGILGLIGGKRLAKGFDALGKWLKEKIWEPIKQFFFNIFDIEKFKDIWKGDGSVLQKIGKSIGQGLITLVKLPFKAIIEGGKLTFTIAKNIGTAILNFGKMIWNKIKEEAPKIWKGIKEFFSGLWNGLSNALSTLWKAIKEGVPKIWKGLKNIISSAWKAIKKITPKLLKGIKKLMSKVWKGITEFIPKLWNGVKDVISKAWNGIKDVTDKAWNGIKEGISNGWDKVKEKTSQAWDKAKDLISDIKDDFAEGGIKGVVDGLFEKLKTKINDFFTNNPIGKWINDHIIEPIKNGLGKIGNFFGYINENWDWHHPFDSIQKILGANKADINIRGRMYTPMQIYDYAKVKGEDYDKTLQKLQADVSKQPVYYQSEYKKEQQMFETYIAKSAKSVNDAIIRPNGDIIQTDPKDTIVALKDIPNSMSELKNNVDKQSISMISSIKFDDSLDKKLSDVISLLSKIAEKNLEIQLPQQTRRDMEVIMNGGLI